MGLSNDHLDEYEFYLSRDEVPHGWDVASLLDLSFIVTDGTHKTPQYKDRGVRFISIKNIRPFQPINWDSYEKYISVDEHRELTLRCDPEPDDILFPRIGTLGFAKRIDFEEEVSLFVGLGLIKPVKKYVSPKYLEYYMNTPYIDRLSRKRAKGTGRKTLPLEESRQFPVPLAPWNEQHRIVAKIEELFSELDKGIESLEAARAQLKIYRQTFLKHAFEGKLTEKWREENKDNLTSSDKLLERIKSERKKHHEEKIEAWKVAVKASEQAIKVGKKPSKPRAPKSLDVLADTERKHLANLPNGWCWDKLGWMTCGVEYGTSAKSSDSGDVPVLRMGNIQNGKFDWSDLVYTSDKDEIAKYDLAPGDVLFNRTNSPELVGKTAIYRGKRQAIFAGYLIRVNQIPAVVDSQYLNLYLNSHTAKQHGNQVKTDGVNQSNINGEKLQNYPFPFCSIEEQKEIVRILDKKLSIIDQVESDIGKQLSMSSALRQSVLKRAYSGQLVEQDPNDEPASELLARIRVEKEERENAKKAIKKKVKKKAKRKDAA